MQLYELLLSYRQLSIVDKILDLTDQEIKDLIIIKEKNNGYNVLASDKLFMFTGPISINIELDTNCLIVGAECRCLEHYRKKECVHLTIVYALALRTLNPLEYNKQVKAYRREKLTIEQQKILNSLAADLRTNSSYFQKIHLAVEINCKDGYYLSLHIGYDKEYVIKSISEFVDNMEGNKYYAYGQKLAFTHSYEVLDDVSKEFYSFLLNLSHEDSLKSIKLKRNQLLKILEIYHNSGIYFSFSEDKSDYYPIVDIDNVKIILDDKLLYIDKPIGSKELICGINYAYFLGQDRIYAYHFKKRNEAIIFNALFKSQEKSIYIEAVEKDFIANLLPVLKQEVTIEETFYERFSLPPVLINSYFIYQNGNIINNYQINVEKSYSNTPYVEQILDGYLKSLESFGFEKAIDGYMLTKAEQQYYFLTSDISALKNYGEVFFDESIKRITLKKSNRVTVSISYNVGLLDFKFDGGNLTIEEVQAMLNAYHQKKHFVKLKNDIILEINDADVKEIDNFLEDFNIKATDLSKKVKKPINYLLKLVGCDDKNVDLDDKIIEMIKHVQNYNSIDSLPPSDFTNVLRPYQLEGFKWLKTLASFGFGGILADDMGLGKTLEIIAFIASDEIAKPTLIVCPMSLVYNWENECEKWHFKVSIKLIIGSAIEREETIKNIDYQKKGIYITSYDSLRRDISLYEEEFRFIIADEAQYIKNQNALKSTAIKQIKSDMNFALTGTPIENGLADLWSIFDFLMPGYLADYNHFKERYESLIMHDDYEALDLLKKRVRPFILRRTKKDVLKELPDKLEEIYYCKMGIEQEKLYQSNVLEIKQNLNKKAGSILALLTRLRQICITPELIYDEAFDSAKLQLALELIRRGLASKHRILLFSQFSSVFPIISKMLTEEGIKHFSLDGSTSALRRIELVDEFNRNPEIGVFMISLKAGGTGLNLVGADMVIHLDPWWNLSAENQATDRAYRLGQTKKVFVVKLVCKGTIEEKVLKLQQLKSELANSIIYDQSQTLSLTKEDILELLD